jgi:hypothetical protein
MAPPSAPLSAAPPAAHLVASLAQIRLADPPPSALDDDLPCCGLICGGVVVGVRGNVVSVLTAAHCLDPREPVEVRLWRGSGAGASGRILVDSPGWVAVPPEDVTILRHPGYSAVTLRNDVALLRCRVPLSLAAAVRPVQLPRNDSCTPLDRTGIVAGFSLTDGHEAELSLRTAAVSIEREAWPQITSRHVAFDPRWHAWAVGQPNQGASGVVDTCAGDSGGPLLDATGTRLIGLTSWGVSCGVASEPGVYALICPFMGPGMTHASFRRVRSSSPWSRGLSALVEERTEGLRGHGDQNVGQNAWVRDRPAMNAWDAPLEQIASLSVLPALVTAAALLMAVGAFLLGRGGPAAARTGRFLLAVGAVMTAMFVVAMLVTYC